MTTRQEAEEARGTAAYENKDSENDSVSVLSGHASEEAGSESLEWMKQAARCVQGQGRQIICCVCGGTNGWMPLRTPLIAAPVKI